MTDKQLKIAIAKQKQAITRTGFDPSWSLFSHTLAWFQLQKKLTPEERQRYQELWQESETSPTIVVVGT